MDAYFYSNSYVIAGETHVGWLSMWDGARSEVIVRGCAFNETCQKVAKSENLRRCNDRDYICTYDASGAAD
jgi:hypothetical protein